MNQPSSPDLPEDAFLIERDEHGICTVTLNRPAKLNAQSMATMRHFRRLIEDIGNDDKIRVVILTGAGRGFCAGLDLGSPEVTGGAQMSVPELYRSQETFAGTVQRLRRLDKPVIGAINGVAVGAGCALALACDIRLASSSASFHIGAVKIGLSAGECGITYILPRLIGASRAFELMLTGRPVDAAEAERIGLVSALTEPEDLMPQAREMARVIAGNAPFSMKHTKQMMLANLDAPSFDAAVEMENRAQILGNLTHDFREATAAFRERRTPRFSGQ